MAMKTIFLFTTLLFEVAYMQTFPPLMMDNTKIANVPGESGVNKWWIDSYSVGDRCYCSSFFNTNIGSVLVMTPFGTKTVKEACSLIGPGPGITGRPTYNDIQCGNGPPNDRGDEVTCPGRTEYGIDGCKYIGPTWKFNSSTPVAVPVLQPVPVPQPNPVSLPVPQPKSLPVPTPLSAPIQLPIPVPVPKPNPVPLPVPQPISLPIPVPLPAPVQVPVLTVQPKSNVVPAPLPLPTIPISSPILGKPPLLLDTTKILKLPGVDGAGPGWEDSYSVGDRCYCSSSFDHDIGTKVVHTIFGHKTVKEVCTILGAGPGKNGRPVYNDIQCGNGPPNGEWDEELCPGRVDWGKEGCKYVGPKWNFL
jgi:hypothetical protein